MCEVIKNNGKQNKLSRVKYKIDVTDHLKQKKSEAVMQLKEAEAVYSETLLYVIFLRVNQCL